LDKIAFIDLEASSLAANSWPIEVGWCFEAGAPETHLIEPFASWPRTAWDPQAEALHGVSLDELMQKGRPGAAVCHRLNAALKGAKVYSDAPDWDSFWLYRLFSTAGVRQRFSLGDLGGLLVSMAGEKLESIFAEADRTAPRRHRACEDVLHMRALYALARRRGGDKLGP
jgi:hypothetical protein